MTHAFRTMQITGVDYCTIPKTEFFSVISPILVFLPLEMCLQIVMNELFCYSKRDSHIPSGNVSCTRKRAPYSNSILQKWSLPLSMVALVKEDEDYKDLLKKRNL